jgi:tetratricopeptide (TPR) repeat protein
MPSLTLVERMWRVIPEALFRVLDKYSIFWDLKDARWHTIQRRFKIAQAEYDKGSKDQAIEQIQLALAVEPRNVKFLTSLGSLYFEEKRFEEAAEAFGRVLEIDYFNPKALKGRGYSLDILGRTDDAIYHYLQFLSQSRDDRDVYANLMAAFSNCAKTDEAISTGETAKARFPNDATFPTLLSQAYYAAGRLEDAEREIEAACRLDPSRTDVYEVAGLVYSARNKPHEAAASFQRAISVNPDRAYLHMNLAHELTELGRFEETVAATEKAKRLYEATSDTEGLHGALWELGWAYLRLARWSESIDASTKAIELNPAIAGPRFNLGLALLRKGEIDKSRDAYRAGMALNDLASLERDGIAGLSGAIEENPNLLGAPEILNELQACAEKSRAEGKYRRGRRTPLADC